MIPIVHLAEPSLEPDYSRLVIRSFVPLEERILAIMARISTLPEAEIQKELEQVIGAFSADHMDLVGRIKEHYAEAEGVLRSCAESDERLLSPDYRNVSPEGRLLAGAYFTSEYAFEATALFNPSIVQDNDQRQSAEGTIRFIMSTRSVGEGHISSISFRTGTIDKGGKVFINPVERTAVLGKISSQDGVDKIQFDERTPLSQRLIFPISPAERNGIEDARFVRFVNDDGTFVYYATYTAYDGKNILPRLLKTDDFLKFEMRALGGSLALNKGMALFPRKINGQYAMLSRVDGESVYLMFSDDLYTWNSSVKIAAPRFPWEFMQIGNCGSPLELDEGWLVLTHGVGSLRRYSIGAMLLDKNDPAKVIGRLPEPLISPGERERTGYVPNVVYTCGSIIHQGKLIIPYGSADRCIAFITVELEELIKKLTLG
jgi:predicted GH43/DUF377 family glycosyl hydrolase